MDIRIVYYIFMQKLIRFCTLRRISIYRILYSDFFGKKNLLSGKSYGDMGS
jgi:hypothetical protein